MEVKEIKEAKETPKKRKSTSCIGCKYARKISDNAYVCTSDEPDMKNFTCYK